MGLLENKKITFVCPGQGSQALGMGKDFFDNSSVAKAMFLEADNILGYKLSQLCFEGPLEELSKTVYTQPALYTVSAIAYKMLSDRIKPLACAGHSAGEYAALYIAGAFDFETGLRLISQRAVLMNEIAQQNPGSMAAVLNLSIEKINEINSGIDGVCVSANINSPGQIVVSGEKEAVATASELYKAAGAKRIVPLNVSGAFHSPLMREAGKKLGVLLENISASDLSVPLVANFTADTETVSLDIKKNLEAQITGSVRWVESVEKLGKMGTELFIELGSGSVLCGLIKKICPHIPAVSVGSFDDINKLIND